MGLNGVPSITDSNLKPETGTGYGEQKIFFPISNSLEL